ncbi:MAG: O-antigen ligase family protein, partial [Devosiaceae bacterium]|nr:O-antigen ligase family protein [Devosiaceae bacterium MH13]
GDGVVDRLDSLQTDWSVRGAIYADTIAGILQRPFFGFGGGSFAAAFPSFRSEALASPGAVDLAHNTYLALAFEFGVPVTMAWLALLAVTGWRTARAVLSRRGHAFELPLAAVGAATVVGVHSAIDFSAEMHAIALWLAALCGGACGVIVWSGSRRSRQGAG